MGKPGPQPRSTTAVPRGSALAQSRTLFTPIVVDRVLTNSAAMPSYPFDRSIMESPYQSGLKVTMNALFLKDLTAKTHRGIRGRVEKGKSGGGSAL